jgi:hypothetical protein
MGYRKDGRVGGKEHGQEGGTRQRQLTPPGVRAAAIRKLPHELGIPESQLNPEDFTYLTRIHYLAPSDGVWGEHESELSLRIKATRADWVQLTISSSAHSTSRQI